METDDKTGEHYPDVVLFPFFRCHFGQFHEIFSELVARWELFVEYLADIVLAISIDVVILVVEPQDNVADRGDGSEFQLLSQLNLN